MKAEYIIEALEDTAKYYFDTNKELAIALKKVALKAKVIEKLREDAKEYAFEKQLMEDVLNDQS